MSDTNNATATAPATPTVPAETNGKHKAKPGSAAAVLKEVQQEGGAKEKTAPGKQDKAKPGRTKEGKSRLKEKADAHATATEGEKKPDPNAPMLNPLALPEPVLEILPRTSITEDRRLQHRKDMQDTSEGGAVDQYAEKMKEGVKFPALKIVRDVSETKNKGTLWLYDGYQRLGAYKKNKTGEIPCEIIEGNFADALLLSLGSNGENSVIPRTKADAQRSVNAILDNPTILEPLLAYCKGNGGVHRVFADVCKVSTGTVDWALKARGLKPKGAELVKYTPPKKAEPESEPTNPTPAANPAIAVTPTAPAAQVTPEEQRKLDQEAFARMQEKEVPDLIAESRKCVRRLAAIFSALVISPKYGQAVTESLNANGMPVDAEFFRRKEIDGAKFAPFLEMLELWPLVEISAKIIDGTETAIKAVATPEPTSANQQA